MMTLLTAIPPLVALALPAVVFISGLWLMNRHTRLPTVQQQRLQYAAARNLPDEASKRAAKGLHKRFCGYTRAQLIAHYDLMSPISLQFTARLLKLDGIFALAYTLAFWGAFAALLLPLAQTEGFTPTILILTVMAVFFPFMTLVFDYCENFTLLRLIENYSLDRPLDEPEILSASQATQIKLASFILSSLLLLAVFAMRM